ncbi:MAG: homoserine O-succinyltransferase [Clostridia bacterium]|nr:homoserine O-succinyltransferase [Clostridia bacterium]
MSFIVPSGLPAIETLAAEGIKLNTEYGSDDRAVRILLLNLMPTKQATETQLIRMLSSADIPCELYLMNTVTYVSKNTDSEYLERFYKGFDFYKDDYFDGLIITGAPVEQLDFKQVLYWDELAEIFNWAKTHVSSVYSICWGAQAALYAYYGIPKYPLPQKMFGIFEHEITDAENPLLKGIKSPFMSPQSRHAEVRKEDILSIPELSLVAVSDIAGVHVVTNKDLSLICVTGHPEYDADTLAKEYFRDVEKGDEINCPSNYFPDDNPINPPVLSWREDGKTLYGNWVRLLASKKDNK